MSPTRGVYFLANDAILDLAIAFLASFRVSNPTIPLCLVPFDAQTHEVVRLRDKYAFSVWTASDSLHRCDDISRAFHGRVFGHYRKLAIWEGPFDEFVYIDSDTVVLAGVDVVFPFLRDFAFVASHAYISTLLKFVWKDSIFATEQLSQEQIRFAMSTGFIASCRNALTLDRVEAALAAALALAPHMELSCIEQPLINYLIVTSGQRYTSLLTLARARLCHDIPLERWGGNGLGAIEEGRLVNPSQAYVLLVHWAGWGGQALKGTMPNQDLWRYYRNLHEELPGDGLAARVNPGDTQ